MSDADNPYLKYKAAHDTELNKALTEKRKLWGVVVGLFFILAGSVYGNVYQLRQYKIEDRIHTIDDHGRAVVTQLRRVEEIPDDDPAKQNALRNYLLEHIKTYRERPMDQVFLVDNLNLVARQMVGPAVGKFRTAYEEEKPLERIKRERVAVEWRGEPFHIPNSNVWQTEWMERVTNQHGYREREDIFSGRFDVIEDEKKRGPGNPFGFVVADWSMDRIETTKAGRQ